jgi:hypothetical protein
MLPQRSSVVQQSPQRMPQASMLVGHQQRPSVSPVFMLFRGVYEEERDC